jgi:hypothetical protein
MINVSPDDGMTVPKDIVRTSEKPKHPVGV